MTGQQVFLAIWRPAWHEMDQSLFVGEHRRLWFDRSHRPAADVADRGVRFVFYNQLMSHQDSEVRYATIVDLKHDQLGALSRVDADGLDYVFQTNDGREVIVNAEEEPGALYDSDLQVPEWNVWVPLSDVTDPVADHV